MSDRDNHDKRISFHKAILWEEAKGKMRALIAATGQTYSGGDLDRYNKVQNEVEKFIKYFESNGYHE